MAPTGEKASDLVSKLAREVLKDPSVTVYTCAEVAGFDGYVGNFNLKVKTGPPASEEVRIRLEGLAVSEKEE